MLLQGMGKLNHSFTPTPNHPVSDGQGHGVR